MALGIPAIVFVVVGLGWWLAPRIAASQFGLVLQEGRGLSSQLGDFSAFFLTLGGCVLIAATTGARVWLYPAMMLTGLAAVGRLVAWGVHGAALTVDLIAVELAVTAFLYYAARSGGVGEGT
jgi:hypothetical protein